jgi:hypothetical protein
MVIIPFAVVIGCLATVGFVNSIVRKAGEKASFIEWFVSVGVGSCVAAATYSLLH